MSEDPEQKDAESESKPVVSTDAETQDTPKLDQRSVQPQIGQSFTLTRSDQVVAAILAAIVILLGILQWGRLSGWGVHPIEIGELPPVENQFRLDINTATEIQWSQLDRIGEVLAERIVQDRETNGSFESIDDLSRVEGIGPQTLEQIRPWLTIKPSD